MIVGKKKEQKKGGRRGKGNQKNRKGEKGRKREDGERRGRRRKKREGEGRKKEEEKEKKKEEKKLTLGKPSKQLLFLAVPSSLCHIRQVPELGSTWEYKKQSANKGAHKKVAKD